MQTRRDQLQAYRFQNRRALAALVTGEPNVVEPPMRRLTVITISGIMIAILVAVVFALLGMFSPDTGDSWKEAGAVIVEQRDRRDLRHPLDGKLHPVSTTPRPCSPSVPTRRRTWCTSTAPTSKDAPRGFPIGIPGLPDSAAGEVGIS